FQLSDLTLHDSLPISFQARQVQTMAGQKRLVEHHRHFLVVLRSDPDVAAVFVEQVQAVVAAVEAERQGTARGVEELLDPGVQARSEEHTSELQSRENL